MVIIISESNKGTIIRSKRNFYGLSSPFESVIHFCSVSESIENCIYTEVTDVVSFFLILKSARVISLSLVGLWSDSVGDIHLWEGAICWNTCHMSSAQTKERPQTGETQQHSLQ